MITQWYRISRACIALVGAIVLGGGSAAVGGTPVEELTKRLPDGVIGFAATSGGDALQEDFGKTALSRIWNDPGVRSFCGAIGTELVAKIQQAEAPDFTQKADMVRKYARLVLSRPLLVGIAQTQAKDGPPICVFTIVDAGDRKPELEAAVSRLEALVGADMIADTEVGSLKMQTLKDADDFPLCWGWAGNHLVIAMNDVQGTVLNRIVSPRADVAPYLGKVATHGDALVVYYDYQRLAQFAGAMAAQDGGPEQAKLPLQIFKGLGFDTAKFVGRLGFAGPDLAADALIMTPTPPTGILAAYRPIDLSWLGAVDIRAVTATAINCDLGSFYDTILNLLKTVSPDEGYLEIRRVIVDFEADAKLRIREGLLTSLAGPALWYTLPAGSIAEAPRGGLVAVAKLKDASLFEKSLSALEEFVGSKAKGSLQIGTRTRDDGRTVHVWSNLSLAMLNIMPAWSIANDHVVIGSTVELCDLGVKQLVSQGTDGKSLLNAEGYRKVAASLPKGLVSFTYTDSQVQLDQTMMQLRQFWPMVTMIAAQAQISLPALLPSLTDIVKDLGPSCTYRYFDPSGLHACHRGSGVEISQGAIAGAALGAGIALPAMAKARERARNVAAISNMRQIGQALVLYANDHQGNWPEDLEQTKPYLSTPALLDSDRKPKDFEGPSYIYIAGQPEPPDHRNVVVYENPGFCKDRINVLFIDGHVEFLTPDAFRRELQATYERLGREVPEIRFQGETNVQPHRPRPPRPPRSDRPAEI